VAREVGRLSEEAGRLKTNLGFNYRPPKLSRRGQLNDPWEAGYFQCHQPEKHFGR
jgi:hypothetical protein